MADNSATTIGVIRYHDGGGVRVVLQNDGGVSALLPDGGSLSFRVDAHPCMADAGVLLSLLGQTACDDDRDCVIVQPEVNAANVGCCYAVDARVARSRSLKEALDDAANQCGWATRRCLRPCEKAQCHKGTCRVAAP